MENTMRTRSPESKHKNATKSPAHSMALVYQRCINRLICDKSVTVKYIPACTGHKPGPEECKLLPLPQSIQETVSLQPSMEIPAK